MTKTLDQCLWHSDNIQWSFHALCIHATMVCMCTFIYVECEGAWPRMHCPVGWWLTENEVNSARQLPIGSRRSLRSDGDVTANMSQAQANSRNHAELCFSIHSYSFSEAEPNLYPSVSSSVSHQNKRPSRSKSDKKMKWVNWSTLKKAYEAEMSVFSVLLPIKNGANKKNKWSPWTFSLSAIWVSWDKENTPHSGCDRVVVCWHFFLSFCKYIIHRKMLNTDDTDDIGLI